jgi:hypothetical protein|uniref:Uncharacterized protein n=1 Tax=viral metagenome TaxID=1070528 RepID=A0A6C0JNU4_9ZZZZ
MSKSVTFLNYTALLILYIVSFIVIYQKNTEIIGFYFLFVVNAVGVIYNLYYFTNAGSSQLIPTMIYLSLFISGLFHTICFIFVIMMISDMRVKYSNTYGTPMNIPPKYKIKFELFKRLTISTFALCAILLLILLNGFDFINIQLSNLGSIKNIIVYYFPQLLVLVTTLVPVIISCVQIVYANEFSMLSRRHFAK